MYKMVKCYASTLQSLCGQPSFTLLNVCFNVINLTSTASFIILPYWFYHAGLLFGVISLSLCLVLCGIASFWVLECLGRASLLYRNSEYSCLNEKEDIVAYIDSNRNFELNEMSKIIMGKICDFIVSLVVILTSILCILAGIVLGSQALAVNIPINTTVLTTCNSSDFDASFLPVGNCLNWYRVVVGTFGIVATVLACLKSKNQIYVIVLLLTIRLIVMSYMVGFSIFSLRNEIINNHTVPTNFVASFEFDKGMLAIGSFFSFISLPTLIPSMTHSIKNKSKIRPMIIIALILSTIILISYGSTLAFAFGTNIHQNSFLNFQPYTMDNHGSYLRITSHLILLYPCLDGLSSCMYGVILASNQTFSIITRKDFSEVSKKISYRILNLMIYLFYSIFPIFICLFVSNFATIVGSVGLGSFIANITIPCLLQITSNRKCSKVFTLPSASNSENKSIFRKVQSFLSKSYFPTPYSSFYSSHFMVITLSTISTLVFFTSFYFIIASVL